MNKILVYNNYADFRNDLCKIKRSDMQSQVFLVSECYTWNTINDCLADHEE